MHSEGMWECVGAKEGDVDVDGVGGDVVEEGWKGGAACTTLFNTNQ